MMDIDELWKIGIIFRKLSEIKELTEFPKNSQQPRGTVMKSNWLC